MYRIVITHMYTHSENQPLGPQLWAIWGLTAALRALYVQGAAAGTNVRVSSVFLHKNMDGLDWFKSLHLLVSAVIYGLNSFNKKSQWKIKSELLVNEERERWETTGNRGQWLDRNAGHNCNFNSLIFSYCLQYISLIECICSIKHWKLHSCWRWDLPVPSPLWSKQFMLSTSTWSVLLCRDEVVASGGQSMPAGSPDCTGSPGQEQTSQPGQWGPAGEEEEGRTW